MQRKRLTITLRNDVIEMVDTYIDGMKVRNRSHAIEYLLLNKFDPAVKKAVILAADQGIKFRPFTYETPKAMLPIKGRPLLEHIITRLREHDVRDIYISVGYLSDKVESYFGDGSKFGVTIHYVKQEKNDMGTGGALRNFAPFFKGKEAFFLIYGDVLAEADYHDIARFYFEHRNDIGIMALTTVKHPELWGVATLQGDQIVAFTEKPRVKEAKSHLISAGLFLLTPQIFSSIPKGHTVSLEKEVLPKVISRHSVSGYVVQGKWYDISTPAIYARVLKEWT